MTSQEYPNSGFDPNGAAAPDSGIFGLGCNYENSDLIIFPVPWEGTVSEGGGTSSAPKHIEEESMYVELHKSEINNFFERGIFMIDPPEEIIELSKYVRNNTENSHSKSENEIGLYVKRINENSEILNSRVYEKTTEIINQGKLVGLLGGEHSIALGSIKAHSEKYKDMSVLQFDAHADLRDSFEGYKYSHASIMHNVLNETKIGNLVQVGIRAFCEEEHGKMMNKKNKISPFFSEELNKRLFKGESWDALCEEIVDSLNQHVYISFDVDGLDIQHCRSTGTPVPGGLGYNEAVFLMKKIVEKKKKIVGFDLVEVGSDKTDANIAAHLVFDISSLLLKK